MSLTRRQISILSIERISPRLCKNAPAGAVESVAGVVRLHHPRGQITHNLSLIHDP